MHLLSMTRSLGRGALSLACAALATVAFAQEEADIIRVDTSQEPVAQGPFEPTRESLNAYEAPEWFRDAKFGIWAHWGPQCEPEAGDWYARTMYDPNNWQGRVHREKYGHPSEFGFKDVINEWKAEAWDPESLVELYKRAGARYFVALANHHDNMDLWDSTYQPWNSVNMGPKKDLIAGWAEAARKNGLYFGVSVHASHAWRWYESSQLADPDGPMAGVPYDGNLTAADGVGKWWEGYDPQDLYAQNHPLSRNTHDLGAIHGQWDWNNGAVLPSQEYCTKFYNRTVELINKFKPDLIYFDDSVMPLYPISDAGFQIAAHLYNDSASRNGGVNQAVMTGKVLSREDQDMLTWDVERGVPHYINEEPWQTCTCLGTWHYERGIYDRDGYKSPRMVVHMLVDIVSKNGNLLLSVPLRGDGSIDDKCLAIVSEVGKWLDVHGEAIYGTRPWVIYGEGPAMAEVAELRAQGFNEGAGRPFNPSDFRFTTKGDVLYAIAMGWPEETVRIEALGRNAGNLKGEIAGVEMLGSDETLQWEQTDEALVIQAPSNKVSELAVAFKVTTK